MTFPCTLAQGVDLAMERSPWPIVAKRWFVILDRLRRLHGGIIARSQLGSPGHSDNRYWPTTLSPQWATLLWRLSSLPFLRLGQPIRELALDRRVFQRLAIAAVRSSVPDAALRPGALSPSIGPLSVVSTRHHIEFWLGRFSTQPTLASGPNTYW